MLHLIIETVKHERLLSIIHNFLFGFATGISIPQSVCLRAVVGRILSMVMALEIGRVDHYTSAVHLASYSALVSRVHSSSGHNRPGQSRRDANHYLKWALSRRGRLYRREVPCHQKIPRGSFVRNLTFHSPSPKNGTLTTISLDPPPPPLAGWAWREGPLVLFSAGVLPSKRRDGEELSSGKVIVSHRGGGRGYVAISSSITLKSIRSPKRLRPRM